MLCYNDAYSFSFSFNIILHNLLDPTETTLWIIYFITPLPIVHTLSSRTPGCGCCWHFYIIHIFYRKFALHFRAQVICQPLGCWLLFIYSLFFSLFFSCGKTLFPIMIPASKIYCLVFCDLLFFPSSYCYHRLP